jgi:hypothetical protein
MAHIINGSGAETDLFENLSQRGISRFSSIDDLFAFKKIYRHEIDDFRQKKVVEVKEEIEKLSKEVISLWDEYEHCHEERTESTNNEIAELESKLSLLSQNWVAKIKRRSLNKRLSHLKSHFDEIVDAPLRGIRDRIREATTQFDHLSANRQEVVEKRSAPFIAETERIISVLTELAPVIYGAIGELKAIEILRRLPDSYYVINDYQRSFHRPLHMKNEDDWIYSIQLDHVVVGPTGVFVIETKYWSQKSIANNNLFSPVKQLRRGGFALFVIINNGIRDYQAFNSHWGSAQVSVANILLMMNATTNEQFQFVKILTELNLLDFITRRPAILSSEQIKCLVEDVI